MTKDELIEKHRYWNVEHDWAEYMLDQAREELEAKGWHIGQHAISYSGFGQQGAGAGASFEGFMGGDNLAAFIAAWGNPEDFPGTMALGEIEPCLGWSFTLTQSGNYSHKFSVSGELSGYEVPIPDDIDDTRWAMLQVLTTLVDQENPRLCELMLDAARSDMDKIYRDLEAEYDWLTSDEQVWESLQCHGVDEELDEEEDDEDQEGDPPVVHHPNQLMLQLAA